MYFTFRTQNSPYCQSNCWLPALAKATLLVQCFGLVELQHSNPITYQHFLPHTLWELLSLEYNLDCFHGLFHPALTTQLSFFQRELELGQERQGGFLSRAEQPLLFSGCCHPHLKEDRRQELLGSSLPK